METFNMTLVHTGVLSVLLSVIAFFLKSLQADFKKVERDVNDVKTSARLIKAALRSGYDLQAQRTDFLEQRIEQLEEGLKIQSGGKPKERRVRYKAAT